MSSNTESINSIELVTKCISLHKNKPVSLGTIKSYFYDNIGCRLNEHCIDHIIRYALKNGPFVRVRNGWNIKKLISNKINLI
jgi:ribosome-associated toxin RatA of RatAB toxin-antitoxin module